MDREKKYTKGVYKKRPKLHMNDPGMNRKKDEQAATLESSKKTLDTFKRISNYSSPSWKNRHNKNLLKPVMLAVLSALVIGSLFGVILLRMFVTMDGSPDISGNTNPAVISTDDAEEENKEASSAQEESSTVTFDSITAYVLQAGVFSERENAELWAINYEAENIPTMIWQREGQYFLFAGLANTAEKAKHAAEELETGELELYSKEWKTPLVELSLTIKEEEWINSYLEWWNQALSSSPAEEITSQLEELTASFPDGADQISPLYEKMVEMKEGNEINDKTLLELWFIYESLHE